MIASFASSSRLCSHFVISLISFAITEVNNKISMSGFAVMYIIVWNAKHVRSNK